MKSYETVYLFRGTILFLHMLYIAVFAGIVVLDESYLHIFSTIIQFGICTFLIYRFFPYYKGEHVLTKLDVYVIFYCSTFLLLNVVSVQMYALFIKGTFLDRPIIPIKLNNSPIQ